MASKEDVASDVRLVVADVDGTLVTPDKVLTPRARAVVRTIIEAGIAFTITSGRPPLGMKTLIDDLDLRDPVAAFNGGLVVRPDLSIIREYLVTRQAAEAVIDILTKHKLDVWVYGDIGVAGSGNHFMKVDLLASQFDSLEEPDDALVVDVSAPPSVIVEHILSQLRICLSNHVMRRRAEDESGQGAFPLRLMLTMVRFPRLPSSCRAAASCVCDEHFAEPPARSRAGRRRWRRAARRVGARSQRLEGR